MRIKLTWVTCTILKWTGPLSGNEAYSCSRKKKKTLNNLLSLLVEFFWTCLPMQGQSKMMFGCRPLREKLKKLLDVPPLLLVCCRKRWTCIRSRSTASSCPPSRLSSGRLEASLPAALSELSKLRYKVSICHFLIQQSFCWSYKEAANRKLCQNVV